MAKNDPFGEQWGNKVYKTSTHGSWTKESSAKRDEEIAKTVPTRRRASVLREAERTIVYHRASEYGDAKGNFQKIANLWRDAFGWDVHPYQVALAMDLVKTARLTANPKHHDSWVDKAGYAGLGAEVVEADDEEA